MSAINSPKMGDDIEAVFAKLVELCAQRKLCMSGFVWDDQPPFVFYFGTVKEKGPDLTALHLKLCDQLDEALEKAKEG
jgi:hypothetical protein